jgi:hypothetical protein
MKHQASFLNHRKTIVLLKWGGGVRSSRVGNYLEGRHIAVIFIQHHTRTDKALL